MCLVWDVGAAWPEVVSQPGLGLTLRGGLNLGATLELVELRVDLTPTVSCDLQPASHPSRSLARISMIIILFVAQRREAACLRSQSKARTPGFFALNLMVPCLLVLTRTKEKENSHPLPHVAFTPPLQKPQLFYFSP